MTAFQSIKSWPECSKMHSASKPSRPAFMPIENLLYLFHQIIPRINVISQVGSIEIADEHFGILQTELLDDVLLDSLGGRGCVGMNRGSWKQSLELSELPIFGTEVMAPMADALGPADGKVAHTDFTQNSLNAPHH